jgi:hypothetical protein
VGLNPVQGMDACVVCVYCVCNVLCVGRERPCDGLILSPRVPTTVYRIKKLKNGQGCKAIITIIIITIIIIIIIIINRPTNSSFT